MMPRSRGQREVRPAGQCLFRALPALLAIIAVYCLAGCAGSGKATGSLRAESLGDDPVVLNARYVAAVYARDDDDTISFFLSEVPVEDLLDGDITDGQVMHLELLWRPKAGSTPMDSSATNASIRHVIMVDGELGLYGGAGFALPQGQPGKDRMRISLRDATLRLLESTDGFADPLTPARMTGSFTAIHDPQLVRKLHWALSQVVTNALGRSRFVARPVESADAAGS
jgi:hypothetical protein